ncbi:pheromone-processing carboxypeptidase KEX1-like [Diospyros lotus]|uniref:pheromone-processing carboxypeptidase KEX1-like n=1 Tax=Diospyros lotus TaxID=55363 RepID=UPI00225B3A06|nr:pheromone-processing carboxypeptidase KEX1-like [Diospyros lotus]
MKTYGQLVSVNTSRKWYVNDPYVLATQAEQVFYIGDMKNGSSWKIVQKVCPRNVYDVPENVEEGERLILNDEPYQQYEINDVIEVEQIDAENIGSLLREDVFPDEIDASIVVPNKKLVQTRDETDDSCSDEEDYNEEDDTIIDYCDDDVDDKEDDGGSEDDEDEDDG